MRPPPELPSSPRPEAPPAAPTRPVPRPAPSVGTTSPEVDEDFRGHYRAGAKTEYAMGNGTLAHVEEFESLDALQSFLQPQIDEIMRNRYPYLSKASSSGSTRVAEERHNVSVVACLHAVKHESGPHGENDFHVMLGNGTTPGEGIFLTAEASGLPPDGPHRALLLQAREELLSVIGPCRCNGHFMAVLPPIQVRVTGSLCFDGDHVGSTGNEARAASTHRRRASRAKREATLA